MPADQIFVLLLVVGIVVILGWVSLDSRRRAGFERQRQTEAAPGGAAASQALEVGEPSRPARRQRRKR